MNPINNDYLVIEMESSAQASTVPSGHYYSRSLSWTSRNFYFPDSRDLHEDLRDFLGRERGGWSLGDPPGP